MTTEETQAEVLELMDKARPKSNAVYECQLSGRLCVTGDIEAFGSAIFMRVRWCRREAGRFIVDGGASEFLITYFMIDFKLIKEQWR